MEQIYLDGRHYDRLFPPSGDIEFFLAEAQATQGPILELACGTGRIIQRIAEEGFDTAGVDLSEEMLKEARRKAKDAHLTIQYIHGDIRDFAIDKRFALIFIGGNSITHLHGVESFDAFVQCVRRHLTPGGKFIIDVFVPKLELLIGDPEERQPFSEYEDPDGPGRHPFWSRSTRRSPGDSRQGATSIYPTFEDEWRWRDAWGFSDASKERRFKAAYKPGKRLYVKEEAAYIAPPNFGEPSNSSQEKITRPLRPATLHSNSFNKVVPIFRLSVGLNIQGFVDDIYM